MAHFQLRGYIVMAYVSYGLQVSYAMAQFQLRGYILMAYVNYGL